MLKYLKKINKKGLPRKFIIFDTETIEEKLGDNLYTHKLFLGVAVYYERRKKSKDTEEWFVFRTSKEFWDFVESKCYKKTVLNLVSHNIAFDFRVVEGFRETKERGWILERFLSNNWVNIWRFKKGDKKLVVFDNMNYFSVPLSELGESIGIKKLEMPKTYDNIDEWIEYCKRDVEIVLASLKNLLKTIEENDLGYFGYTIASQSLIAFRKRFLKSKIAIKRNKFISDFERKAYYGGRVECFKLGHFDNDVYYHLDINSLYPYVMKTFEMPSGLLRIYDEIDVSFLEKLLEKYLVIAKVKIKTNNNFYPYRKENKLLFPIGEFWTFLATPEIRLALERKEIIKVDTVFVYRKEKLFEDFVNFFYSKRLEEKNKGNNIGSTFYKLILNSLSGKFGQRNDNWVFVGFDNNEKEGAFYVYDIDSYERYLFRCINGKIEKSEGKIEGRYAFPAISAHITSYGRVKLLELMLKAGLENVLYVDTDSLFVNSKGFENLKDELDDREIGKLRLIKKANNVVIYGLKDYQFADEIKIKGIRKNAIQIGDRIFKQIEFFGIRRAIRDGNLNGVIMKEVIKVLKRDYHKGIVLPNGQVLPFRIYQ
jgi:hypothetical protein